MDWLILKNSVKQIRLMNFNMNMILNVSKKATFV
jgi:hypothetical protein